MNVHDILITLASVFTSLSVVGGGFMWMYQKFIIKPSQKMIVEEQKRSNQALKEAITPLTYSIEMLNQNLEVFQKRQMDLFKITDEHARQLGELDARVERIEEND